MATDWYRSDYRPTVEDARGSIGQLIDSMTDADIFLTIHRRRQAWWGSECDAIECAEEPLVEQQMAAARKGTLRRLVLGSPGERASRAPILPLADEAREPRRVRRGRPRQAYRRAVRRAGRPTSRRGAAAGPSR